MKACVRIAVQSRSRERNTHTHKVDGIREEMWLPRVGFCEDVSAPFGLISGAEDEEEADGADEPRSARLRTAGPHRREAVSVSPLGHSHH